MKESGVEWIGKIPKDWEVRRMRNIGVFTSSGINKLINPEEPLVKIINYTDVYGNESLILSNKDYMVVSAKEEQIKKNLVKEGDLIFTPSSETIEDIGVSALVDEDLPNTSFSYHVLRFEFKEDIYKNFKKYLCNNEYVQNIFSSRATGSIRKTLNRNDFKDLKVLIPPIKEQQKIADFLDNKLSEIIKIKAYTKHSIEELKKYKQSIITEAVTKGLDSNIKTKDSGIDWIGKVPTSWTLSKVNRLFSIKKEIANKTGYDVLSVTQRGLKVKDITQNEGQMAADYSKYQIVQPDDFVMNHMDLLTGWVDLALQEGVTSPDYRVFYNKQKELVFNPFYLYVFQVCYLNKIFYGLGQGVSNMGRWRLQSDKFLNFYLPLPPIKEQKEIVFYLNAQIKKVDSLIQDKEQSIEELEKHKKSLIYEYVTGKKEA